MCFGRNQVVCIELKWGNCQVPSVLFLIRNLGVMLLWESCWLFAGFSRTDNLSRLWSDRIQPHGVNFLIQRAFWVCWLFWVGLVFQITENLCLGVVFDRQIFSHFIFLACLNFSLTLLPKTLAMIERKASNQSTHESQRSHRYIGPCQPSLIKCLHRLHEILLTPLQFQLLPCNNFFQLVNLSFTAVESDLRPRQFIILFIGLFFFDLLLAS